MTLTSTLSVWARDDNTLNRGYQNFDVSCNSRTCDQKKVSGVSVSETITGRWIELFCDTEWEFHSEVKSPRTLEGIWVCIQFLHLPEGCLLAGTGWGVCSWLRVGRGLCRVGAEPAAGGRFGGTLKPVPPAIP